MLMSLGHADNRFSRALEYQIMDKCIDTTAYLDKKLSICACALATTQEDGFGPDYDNNEDYFEDKDNFMKKFRKNIKRCSKKKS